MNEEVNVLAFQPFTVKYVIHAGFEVGGVVEKPDVIGAVFGQTEGLFDRLLSSIFRWLGLGID